MKYPGLLLSDPAESLAVLIIVGLFVLLFNAYRLRRIRAGAKFGGDKRDRILLTCGILAVIVIGIVISVFA